ncbi:hypothetical protein LJ707_10385 [Mucilaginibacter sp. UR6-1]|uniref:LolA family protein n=1 Tax=Mucilaginibacter sp. UR6-1 TaxID=1435643 RepID=UPI001E5AC775|nr:hypothetical protein [Mucilaginibacter sp. UR6-1]MCC8409340.1 hypothetical protein [Mucilaginibacter sp. UR6-1]
MHKRLLIFIAAVLCSINSYSQSTAELTAPRITPPPPEAAQLGKYGQMPIDKNSGLPQINIPLYDIKTSRFSIPVSLSYHASGIKVDEMATWVGTGWSLNAGGVITRSIVNMADETHYLGDTLLTRAEIISSNNMYYLKSAILNVPMHDTQPDNFFYNFVNQSGAFVFGKDRKPLLTPYRPVKISYNLIPNTPGTFTALDENGNIYNFKDTERTVSSISETLSGTSSWYLTEMISADKSDTVKFVYDNTSASFPMYSFGFSQVYGPNFAGASGGCNTSGAGSILQPLQGSTTQRATTNPLYIKTIIYKGGKVDFVAKGGRLDGPSRRLDSVIISGYDFVQKKYNRLKSYKIHTDFWYNGLSMPSGYENGNSAKYRMKLDSVTESDRNNIRLKSHQFQYNSVALPPVNYFAQDYWGYYNGKNGNQTLLESKQYIGEPSGTYNNPSNILYTAYTVGGTQGADRTPNEYYMKAGMLEKITYPTKGYTVFNYEPHEYLDYSQTQKHEVYASAAAVGKYDETKTTNFTSGVANISGKNVGFVHIIMTPKSVYPGQLPETPYVRIVRVSDNAVVYEQLAHQTNYIDVTIGFGFDPNTAYKLVALAKIGTLQVSDQQLPAANISIRYEVAQTLPPTAAIGGGLRLKSQENYDSNANLITKETYKYGNNGAGIYMNSSLAFFNRQNRQIIYAYNDGISQAFCSIANNWIYSSSPTYSLSNLSGGPVAYDNITVYQGDSLNNAGMSVYTYENFADSLLIVDAAYQNGVKVIPTTWKNGQLSSETHYKSLGSNQYAKVQEKFTEYNNYAKASGYGLYIGYRFDMRGFQYSLDVPEFMNNFVFFDYPTSSGSRVPKRSITNNYDTNGTTVLQRDTVKYYYNNLNHVYPTRIVSSTSRGDSIVKLVNFPEDMVNAGKDPTGVYAAMKTKNIVSPQIEFTQQKNSVPVARTITNYIDTNSMYLPKTVEFKQGNNASEVRLRYQRYDSKGNPLAVSQDKGAIAKYIWGYKNSYPVAEIKNAGPDSIAYTSFEDEGTGRWTIASAQRDLTQGLTGKVSYNLSNGNINKGGLATTKTYRVSYWRKSTSALAISGTISGAVKGATINGWTYFEHRISGQSTVTLTGTGNIDEVRLYPNDAQMTTYTYDPGVGVTSITDAKNQVSYFEYDSAQRLLNVKDAEGNILKNYCYNYKGQQTGCPVITTLSANVPINYQNWTGTTAKINQLKIKDAVGNTLYTFNTANLQAGPTIPRGTYTFEFTMPTTDWIMIGFTLTDPLYLETYNNGSTTYSFSNVDMSNTTSVQINLWNAYARGAGSTGTDETPKETGESPTEGGN